MKPMYQNMEYPQWIGGANRRRGSKQFNDFSGMDNQGYYEGGGMQAPVYRTAPMPDQSMVTARPVQKAPITLGQMGGVGMDIPLPPGMTQTNGPVGMDVPLPPGMPMTKEDLGFSPGFFSGINNIPGWAQARPIQRSPYQSIGPQGYPRTRNNAFDPRMWDILRMLQMRR